MTYVTNPELRAEVGREGRERALSYFTLDRVLELHLKSYIKLATRAIERKPAPLIKVTPREKQRHVMEKAFSLAALGFNREAIAQYREALQLLPRSSSVPYILTEIAGLYNKLGEYDRAMVELARCEAYVGLITDREIS